MIEAHFIVWMARDGGEFMIDEIGRRGERAKARYEGEEVRK